MALTPTTKLEAVNACLNNIGESPISDLTADELLDDALIASDVVDEICRAVQAVGWHFNTEFHTLSPSNTGELLVPASTLKADTIGADAADDLVLRARRLYDRTNNTYTFTTPKRLELVVYLDFTELPEAARRYIAVRAARVFQERQLGVDSISQENRRDEAQAEVELHHAETDSSDGNFLTNSAITRIVNR